MAHDTTETSEGSPMQTREHKTADTLACWSCDAKLDGHTGVDTDIDAPVAGSVSICIYCGALGVFVGEPVVNARRAPTNEEWREFTTDLSILRTLAQITSFHLARGE